MGQTTEDEDENDGNFDSVYFTTTIKRATGAQMVFSCLTDPEGILIESLHFQEPGAVADDQRSAISHVCVYASHFVCPCYVSCSC